MWAHNLIRPLLVQFKSEPSSKEWRTHLEQSVRHDKLLSEAFPDTKVQLDRIGKQLKSAVDKISGKEKHINKEFDSLGSEFREQQRRLDATQQQYNELTAAVAELTGDLAARSDAVDAIKAQVCAPRIASHRIASPCRFPRIAPASHSPVTSLWLFAPPRSLVRHLY